MSFRNPFALENHRRPTKCISFTSFYNNVGGVHAAKTFHPLLAMKFCKNLQRVVDISDPEWSPYWVNYKMLKVSARGKRQRDRALFWRWRNRNARISEFFYVQAHESVGWQMRGRRGMNARGALSMIAGCISVSLFNFVVGNRLHHCIWEAT